MNNKRKDTRVGRGRISLCPNLDNERHKQFVNFYNQLPKAKRTDIVIEMVLSGMGNPQKNDEMAKILEEIKPISTEATKKTGKKSKNMFKMMKTMQKTH